MVINNLNNQKGNIILVSLLILMGIIATTIGLGFIIINELQQSRDMDYSVIAYYAAESAIEEGLYQFRKNWVDLGDLVSESETMMGKSGASWTRTVSDSVPQVVASLVKKDNFTVDLYDLDDIDNPLGIQSIKIKKNDWFFAEDTWLEVSLAEWTPGAGLTWNQQFTAIYKEIYSPSEDPIIDNKPRPDSNYQLRIKALYDDAPSFTITAWTEDNGGGDQIDIPSFAVITGIGDYVHARQAVQAYLSQNAPLSGIFDYILFSEEPIDKSPE